MSIINILLSHILWEVFTGVVVIVIKKCQSIATRRNEICIHLLVKEVQG